MKRNVLIALVLSVLMVFTACQSTTNTELPDTDRAGYAIELPQKVETIVSLAPSTSQVIESLGLKDKLIAVDSQTPFYVEGVDQLPQFDLMNPDLEALAALNPDLIFTTSMSSLDGDDIFSQLKDLGISIATIPSSESIEEIELDIQFIADSLNLSEKGEELKAQMQEEIDAIANMAEDIEEPKTVLFEIAALPDIYSFGSSTFLNDLLEVINAKNVFADQTSWLAVTEEAAISANPDVILTNVNYIEDSVGEILSRNGWEEVTAIKEESVYYIDNGFSSLPNQNVVKALKEMALAIYPEIFASLKD